MVVGDLLLCKGAVGVFLQSQPTGQVCVCVYVCVCVFVEAHKRGVMDTVTRIQIIDEAVYVSFRINALAKGMNPSLSPPTLGK